MKNMHGDYLDGARYRRFLRRSAVFLAVSAVIVVGVQGNVALAYGEELGDEPLSWGAALNNAAPAESYDPIPENLQDFPWTWQERASQAADQIRDTYPDDFSWFEFASGGPGARIGFASAVPEGAAKIIDTLRSYGEDVEVFSDQKFDELELLAANLYLTAEAQEEFAAVTSVVIELGDSPLVRVTGDTPDAEAVGTVLAEPVAVVAEKIGDSAVNELPIEVEAPLEHEPTDPVYDGMVVGPQSYGRAGGNAISGSTGTCTAGVVVRAPNLDLGVITAGHCANSSLRWHNSSGPALSYRNQTTPPSGDVQFNQSSVMADAWFHYDTGAGRQVLDASNPTTNERVCVFGVGTNAKRCGVVTRLVSTTEYPNSGDNFVGAFIRFDYGTYTNPGDSGGTVYGDGGNTIRGVYSGVGGVVTYAGNQYAQGFFSRISVAESLTGTTVCLDPVPRGC